MTSASLAGRQGAAIHGIRSRGLMLLGVLLLFAAPGPVSALPTSGSAGLDRIASEHYDSAFLARGRAFHRPLYTLYFVETALILVVAWVLALGPLGRWGQSTLAAAGGHRWLARLLLLSAVVAGFALLRLPFSIYSFLHARAYGLRHDAWTGFAGDWLKSVAIGWVLAVVVGLLLLGLFSRWPRTWWVLAAGAVAVLTVAYVMLSPLVIDPMFNRFHRLEDRPLEERLLAIARDGGVPATEVLVADASRRTRAVNAYFTGVGKTRRIVLYDTLVEKFPPDEIALVVAHEVGHWKRHHVTWGLVMGLAATLLGLLVAHGVLGRWAGGGFGGLAGRGDPALVFPAYALFLTLMTLAVVPSNIISRRMETQADLTSLQLTGDRAGFVNTEVRLGRENLSDVVPPAWIEFTLYTHPCNARRIRMAEDYR